MIFVGVVVGVLEVAATVVIAVPAIVVIPVDTDDVIGVRLRVVTGPCGRFGGSWDRAPNSTYWMKWRWKY